MSETPIGSAASATHKLRCSICRNPKTGSHICYCIECFRSYKRDWYRRNRQKEIARCQQYNRNNYERFLEAVRRYRGTDRAKKIAKEYRQNNKDRYAVHDNNKRLVRRYRMSGHVSLADWREIKSRYGDRCAYCGRGGKLEMDHRIPLSRGGLHSPSNIAPACRSCNASKYTMTDIEFHEYRRRRLIA